MLFSRLDVSNIFQLTIFSLLWWVYQDITSLQWGRYAYTNLLTVVTSGGVERRVSEVLPAQSYITLSKPLHCRTPLSMEEYSGKNTGVSRYSLLQGYFWAQRSDPGLCISGSSLTYESPRKNMEGHEGRLSIFQLYGLHFLKNKYAFLF